MFISSLNPGPSRQAYTAVTADYEVSVGDLSRMLEVDPASGSITITLPTTVSGGIFCFVRQITAGTVTFAAGAGATINSLVGSTPSISAQWGSAVVEKRTATAWIISGDLA